MPSPAGPADRVRPAIRRDVREPQRAGREEAQANPVPARPDSFYAGTYDNALYENALGITAATFNAGARQHAGS
jgi:hypothetical protein